MQNKLAVVFGLLTTAVLASSVSALPEYLSAFGAKYPTSTLPSRMDATTGLSCYVCHHPPSFSNGGNCYREAIKALDPNPANIASILDQLDGEDSDGDGISNGEEILMARLGSPDEVGYNPGLVGETGTDPCAANAGEVVTGQRETPLTNVPTVSAWGLVALTLLLVTGATIVLSRHRRPIEAVGRAEGR